jgi:hypothetical protein
MNKTTSSRKLTLNREQMRTLSTVDDADLEQVAGGVVEYSILLSAVTISVISGLTRIPR